MRAVLTIAHGDRDQLQFRPDFPEPTADAGEVVLQIAATALNFHDIFTRRGMPGIHVPLPIIVGSDIAGTIVAKGAGVADWREGDRVLVDPVYRGGKRFGMIGEIANGGRAEFIAVPADQLVRIPQNVSLDDAAALPLAYGTAYRMMMIRGRVGPEDRVLILGASGGVGVACVQLAKLKGAEVIGCASSEDKLRRLRELGADHVVDYTRDNFVGAVRTIYGKPKVTGGGGVTVAVNFTGGDTWTDTQRCVGLGGRIVTCGATAGYRVETDARYLWTFEQTMIGSNGWATSDLAALLALVAGGRLAPVIDTVLPLHEAAEAERLLEERKVFGKVLLKP